MLLNELQKLSKEEVASQASIHTNAMSNMFADEIKSVAHNTMIFSKEVLNDEYTKQFNTETIIEDITTVDAIFKYNVPGSTAVLNFASYKEPGGRFLQGSTSQEETLCHASYLYNVLDTYTNSYYSWNNHNLNSGLYTNRALYSPKVRFAIDKDNIQYCDVLTCAAPNKRVAQKFCHVSTNACTRALKNRIDFVLGILAEVRVSTIILGAYGCGVFCNDAAEVASIFKELLNDKYKGVFKRVIFAIPASENLEAFADVFRI